MPPILSTSILQSYAISTENADVLTDHAMATTNPAG